jgi:hypothetical protein
MVRTRARRAMWLAVALWPLVHLALVKGWRLDAWKLFGFGMYAVPFRDGAEVDLEVFVQLEPGAPPRLVAPGSEPLRTLAEDFLVARRTWGELARPTALLARLRADGATEARVVVHTDELEAASGRVVRRTSEYVDPPAQR